jgi:hypothetical protein
VLGAGAFDQSPHTRTALAHHGAKALRRGEQAGARYEPAQRAFNDRQMLPQPAAQQQQQIQPKKDE